MKKTIRLFKFLNITLNDHFLTKIVKNQLYIFIKLT